MNSRSIQGAAMAVAVLLLTGCQAEIEPPPGQPAPPAEAEVSVAAATVPPGADLPVRAAGFTPNTTADWTMRGHPSVVVVTEADRAPRAVSEPFVVGSPASRSWTGVRAPT